MTIRILDIYLRTNEYRSEIKINYISKYRYLWSVQTDIYLKSIFVYIDVLRVFTPYIVKVITTKFLYKIKHKTQEETRPPTNLMKKDLKICRP